jgi:uncharacterized membrane protein (DUF485 family)
MTGSPDALQRLARRRWRVALGMTCAMILCYFGFILLVAFNKPLMGRRLGSGMSVGILLGALVIVVAWILTLAYVRWANRVYDPELARARPGASP